MAFQKDYDVPEPITHAPCRHLRSKSIYVSGNLSNPDRPDEEGSHHCWCNLTQHVRGPDQQGVSRRSCSGERDCYEGVSRRGSWGALRDPHRHQVKKILMELPRRTPRTTEVDAFLSYVFLGALCGSPFSRSFGPRSHWMRRVNVT